MEIPVLYGVTHDETGAFTARVPRATKISIGKPKGPALHVLVSHMNNGPDAWVLEIGSGKNIKSRPYKIEELPLLKKDYLALRENPETPQRRAPEKLNYFTFSKDAGDGTQVPDFEAILRHGPRPKAVEIVFTDDSPFDAAYAFWSASELKCTGNGIDAKRSVNFTPTPADKEAAAAAKATGARYFPIVGGCWTRGCPYSRPLVKGDKEYRQCGPSGSLGMQMMSDIRLGAKAEYTTTGFRSITQIAACLTELATFTGAGDPNHGTVRGIPLTLALNQFKTNHNGQSGTAFAVRLEFRANSLKALRSKLLEAYAAFGLPEPETTARTVKQLAAPATVEATAEEVPEDATVTDPEFLDDEDMGLAAAAFNSEFVDDDPGDPEDQATQNQEPEAAYAAEKARLMAEAEASYLSPEERAQLQAAEQAEKAAAAESTGSGLGAAFKNTEQGPTAGLFGGAPPKDYVDPGEQGANIRRRSRISFPK